MSWKKGGTLPSTDAILYTATGLLGESVPLDTAGGTTAVASQRVYAAGIPVPNGTTITNVVMQITTKAVGTNPTTVRVGLLNSSRVVLALSGNLNASALFTTATGMIEIPLSAAYQVGASDLYYFAYVQNGTWGSTNITFANAGLGNAPSAIGSKPARCGVVSGQTDLPAVGATLGALGGTTSLPWFGFD